VNNEEDGIVSPADGNIIYIKKIEQGEEPISVKNGKEATLFEFANTGVIDRPCWLIGINMTPFDVHKNCAPVEGQIELNKHFDGEFLSLKHEEALRRNERNTIIIDNPRGKVGVVQTASKLVRRIVTYKKEYDFVSKGEWFGMIKFGSQVDLIIPASCKVMAIIGQQVYAKQTLIAKWGSESSKV
jgi:phosphatidylserine decarboxylase